MIRTVRLAATLGFGVEAGTLAGIQARAGLVAHLSGERIAAELDKLLGAPVAVGRAPAAAATRASSRRSRRTSPPSAGSPRTRSPGEDLWDHTLRSVDAAPAARPVVRLAALLHDIGKPATFADGHFLGHDAVGAELAGAFLDRLRSPRAVRDRVVELVRHHMFSYESNWSDAAVRRFIGKMAAIGDGALEELLELREADNVGSGLPADGRAARRAARAGRGRAGGRARPRPERARGRRHGPHRGARARARDRSSAASSTSCSSRSSPTRGSTSDRPCCCSPSRC